MPDAAQRRAAVERVRELAGGSDLLCHSAGKPTRVFTREELMREVWGHGATSRTRTLDSHACRLRAKLASDTHRLVINVWGVGLRLIDQ